MMKPLRTEKMFLLFLKRILSIINFHECLSLGETGTCLSLGLFMTWTAWKELIKKKKKNKKLVSDTQLYKWSFNPATVLCLDYKATVIRQNSVRQKKIVINDLSE